MTHPGSFFLVVIESLIVRLGGVDASDLVAQVIDRLLSLAAHVAHQVQHVLRLRHLLIHLLDRAL